MASLQSFSVYTTQSKWPFRIYSIKSTSTSAFALFSQTHAGDKRHVFSQMKAVVVGVSVDKTEYHADWK